MPRYRRGTGRIYQVPGRKVWMLDYFVNGKRIRESSGTRDRELALEILEQRVAAVRGGREPAGANRVTFEDLAELLFTDYRQKRRKTLVDAERRINRHLARVFGGRRAQSIGEADVERFRDLRRREGSTPAERNRELTLLRRMFNLGVRKRLIVMKPDITLEAESAPRAGFFEEHELRAILARLPSYLRPPVVFAYVTGWRMRAEVLPLTWDRVDLAAGVVRLDPGTTKNGRGRTFYMNEDLRALLEARRGDAEPFPECPFVFHRAGLQIRDPSYAWRKACTEANLPHKLIHDLRRTAARNLIRAGVPERVVMDLCGWETRSVLDRYHIVSTADRAEAARKLDRAAEESITGGLFGKAKETDAEPSDPALDPRRLTH